MQLKQLLRLCTPIFLERQIRRLIDIRELNKTQALECDSTHLSAISEIALNEIFNLREIDEEWNKIKNTIGAFNIPDGTGGVNPGDRKAIYYLIKKLKPSSVLEVGTHIGASTLHIAAALSTNPIAENIKQPNLTTVDLSDVNDPIEKPWLECGIKYSPFEMTNKMNLGHLVDFVKDTSLGYFSKCEQQYDFIFLDGSHTAKTVYQEIPIALNLLNEGGVILLHDYFPKLKPLWPNGSVIPGPYLAIERLKSEGANLIASPLGELPWETKLHSKMTSLALLLKK